MPYIDRPVLTIPERIARTQAELAILHPLDCRRPDLERIIAVLTRSLEVEERAHAPHSDQRAKR